MAAWRRAWDKVIPFFAFPPAVRKVIYTTNAIESVNARLRKIIKTRGHFPSDDAATKLIWLALRNITADWGRAAQGLEGGDEPIRDPLRGSLHQGCRVRCSTDFPTASARSSQATPAAVEKSQSASHTEIQTVPQQQPDKQLSLTDPDARSMATSGRGTGMVGYNVQMAADIKHHLIVAHDVINVGNDRSELWPMAKQAREAVGKEKLEVIADRGYFSSTEILACEQAGIKTLVPKPMTSNSKAEGRFSKLDFIYIAKDDEYLCPAGERLRRHQTRLEDGMSISVYWTYICPHCPLKTQCTTGNERRVRRWEHEAVLDAMQRRLDRKPDAMKVRRRTIEHVFGTLKHWMGSAHFLMKTLHHVGTEMSLHVLAYNLKRVMSVLGITKTMRSMQFATA